MCAKVALQFVVGEILLGLVAGAMNIPQVLPQLDHVVEFIVANLALVITAALRR